MQLIVGHKIVAVFVPGVWAVVRAHAFHQNVHTVDTGECNKYPNALCQNGTFQFFMHVIMVSW